MENSQRHAADSRLARAAGAFLTATAFGAPILFWISIRLMTPPIIQRFQETCGTGLVRGIEEKFIAHVMKTMLLSILFCPTFFFTGRLVLRIGNGKSSEDLRFAALVAMLAGLAWLVPAFLLPGYMHAGAEADKISGVIRNAYSVRSALSIYYGDVEGQFPSELASLTVGGKYFSQLPVAKAPNSHPDSSVVRYGKVPNDSGGWLYDNVKGDPNLGTVWINCTHTDSKGTVWSSY